VTGLSTAKQPEETAKTSDKPATEQANFGERNFKPLRSGRFAEWGFCGQLTGGAKAKSGQAHHTVKMTGFKEWTREITVQAESELQLSATLEK